MKQTCFPLFCLLAALHAVPAMAETARASRAVPGQSVASAQRLDALRGATSAADQGRLLELLNSTAADPALPVELREEVLFEYAQYLRSQPPRAVDANVMAFLGAYASRVLVPHEDHPGASVPRFNIRAAAAGVEHSWRRQEASYAGAVLLGRDPALLVQAFRLHADPPVRRGLLDALDSASAGALEAIAFIALDHIEHEPQLAELVGKAALRTGDTRAVEQLLRTSDGTAIPGILRTARETLDEGQLATLLEVAITEASPGIAALAIAELAPAVTQRADTQAQLLQLLGDAELGSAAALALAATPAPGTQAELNGVLLGQAGSLAAARARLALEIMDSGVPERGER
jgi:hypothetical protein